MKKTISIIDMGTNSVLLLIAEKQNTHWSVLYRDAKTSLLGKGMKNGLLTGNAIKRAKNILKGYISVSKKFNCNKIIIIGTSASREAKNITKISHWLKINYGLPLYILSENEEIKYIYSANIKEFPELHNILIFDVGGGSTEFILIYDNNILVQKSLKIGVRRLNNQFLKSQPKINYIKEMLNKSRIKNKISFSFDTIGVGGTVTTLVAVKNKLQKYIPEKVHKQILTKVDVSEFVKLWSTITDKEAKKLIPFDPLRADVLLSGSLILKEIFNYFSIEKIYASDYGLQFGVLYNNSSWDL